MLIYKRILLKLTGEALSGEGQQCFDPSQLIKTAQELVAVAQKKVEIAVVVGGGNILRGANFSQIQNFDRAGADQMGMLGTMINAIALKEAIRSLGHPSEVLASVDMPKVADVFNKSRAIDLLKKGNILILGGGSGNPYFTTDTTAALRALEIDAEVILKATKVDGVYDKDPHKHKDAKKFEKISFDQAIEKQLKIMDQTAFTMCREHQKEICVFNFLAGQQLLKLLDGENVGTTIHA